MKTSLWYPGKVLNDGWIYVGIGYDENRKEYYRLAMSPHDIGPITWHKAKENYASSMPTSKELHLISNVPKGSNNYYWASTEYTNTNAYIERFSDGYQYVDTKNYPNLLRCVRRWNYFSVEEKCSQCKQVIKK